MDLVFTKHKAARLEPLSQALGPVPGVCSPAIPMPGWGLGWAHGHRGPSWAEWQAACSAPKGLTSQPCRSRAAQAQRGPDTLEKHLCGAGTPSPWELWARFLDTVFTLCFWSKQIEPHWCPKQGVSFELTFVKYLLFAGHWASATKYPVLAGSGFPQVPQFLH